MQTAFKIQLWSFNHFSQTYFPKRGGCCNVPSQYGRSYNPEITTSVYMQLWMFSFHWYHKYHPLMYEVTMGRFEIFSLKWRERMIEAIPLSNSYLGTRSKTVGGGGCCNPSPFTELGLRLQFLVMMDAVIVKEFLILNSALSNPSKFA